MHFSWAISLSHDPPDAPSNHAIYPSFARDDHDETVSHHFVSNTMAFATEKMLTTHKYWTLCIRVDSARDQLSSRCYDDECSSSSFGILWSYYGNHWHIRMRSRVAVSIKYSSFHDSTSLRKAPRQSMMPAGSFTLCCCFLFHGQGMGGIPLRFKRKLSHWLDLWMWKQVERGTSMMLRLLRHYIWPSGQHNYTTFITSPALLPLTWKTVIIVPLPMFSVL